MKPLRSSLAGLRQSASWRDCDALERELREHPARMVEALKAQGCLALEDCDAYWRIRRSEPDVAERTREIAALCGLPEKRS
jgi:hypothetical protein